MISSDILLIYAEYMRNILKGLQCDQVYSTVGMYCTAQNGVGSEMLHWKIGKCSKCVAT